MTWIDSVYVNMSRCHQFSPMQEQKYISVRHMHAWSREIEHMNYYK